LVVSEVGIGVAVERLFLEEEREKNAAKLLPLRSCSPCCDSAACAERDVVGAAGPDLWGDAGAICGDSRRRRVACSRSPPVASSEA
jgi:hypothetical protein